jgi:hypothetical protein
VHEGQETAWRDLNKRFVGLKRLLMEFERAMHLSLPPASNLYDDQLLIGIDLLARSFHTQLDYGNILRINNFWGRASIERPQDHQLLLLTDSWLRAIRTVLRAASSNPSTSQLLGRLGPSRLSLVETAIDDARDLVLPVLERLQRGEAPDWEGHFRALYMASGLLVGGGQIAKERAAADTDDEGFMLSGLEMMLGGLAEQLLGGVQQLRARSDHLEFNSRGVPIVLLHVLWGLVMMAEAVAFFLSGLMGHLKIMETALSRFHQFVTALGEFRELVQRNSAD